MLNTLAAMFRLIHHHPFLPSDLGLVTERGRRLLRQAERASGGSGAACSARWSSCRPGSTASSPRPTATRSHSSDRQAGAHPREGPPRESSVRRDPLVLPCHEL